jgi:predicted adenine nucleotide alpha hydrolase (AANH) superfamily ATPase
MFLKEMVERSSTMTHSVMAVANLFFLRWCRALYTNDADWLAANKGLLREEQEIGRRCAVGVL